VTVMKHILIATDGLITRSRQPNSQESLRPA
jgi:hypothetical protein